MGNNVLPARAGEMLRVVLLAKRTDAGKRELLGTVVAERLLDAIVLGDDLRRRRVRRAARATLPSDKPLLSSAGVVLAILGVSALIAMQILRKRDAMERCAISPARSPARHARCSAAPASCCSPGTFFIWASRRACTCRSRTPRRSTSAGWARSTSSPSRTSFAMLPAAPGYVGTFDAAVIFGVKAIGGSGSAACLVPPDAALRAVHPDHRGRAGRPRHPVRRLVAAPRRHAPRGHVRLGPRYAGARSTPPLPAPARSHASPSRAARARPR